MLYLTGRPLDECVFDRDEVRRIFEHKTELGGGRLLFLVVYRGLPVLANVKGAFRSSGHPELGLLFFILQG